MTHVKLYIDGDRYCALIGKDMQCGDVGFGRTRKEALLDLCASATNPTHPLNAKIGDS